MGNICSKSANKDDNFTGPGRVLGAAGQPKATAPIPAKVKTQAPSQGQTLGGGESTADPRSAAARAAEVS